MTKENLIVVVKFSNEKDFNAVCSSNMIRQHDGVSLLSNKIIFADVCQNKKEATEGILRILRIYFDKKYIDKDDYEVETILV